MEGRIAPTYDAEGDLTGVTTLTPTPNPYPDPYPYPLPEPEPQPYAIQVTILSRVVRGADAEGKMFVRKVDSGCSNFLLALLKERIQGAPILMTRKRQKLRSAKTGQQAALQPEPTANPNHNPNHEPAPNPNPKQAALQPEATASSANASSPLPLEPPTPAEMEALGSEYRLTRALWRHYCSINAQDC